MNKYLPVLAVIAVLIVGGVLFLSSKKTENPVQNSTPAMEEKKNVTTDNATGNQTANSTSNSTSEAGKTVEVTVKAANFAFNPTEIKVKKGDTVKITLSNKEGFHDWNLDEFNAATKKINAGASDTVTFVADKTGTFEYYCSVGNHRQMGMKGNLIVE